MPVLSNPKHERFAQELAQGKPGIEAYVLAGYKQNNGNFVRLKNDERIVKRVDELLGKGAKRAEMTIESLIGEADELQRKSADLEQMAASIAALKLKSIFGGLYVEKQEAKVEQTSHVIERAPTPADWAKECGPQTDSGVAPAGRPAARAH